MGGYGQRNVCTKNRVDQRLKSRVAWLDTAGNLTPNQTHMNRNACTSPSTLPSPRSPFASVAIGLIATPRVTVSRLHRVALGCLFAAMPLHGICQIYVGSATASGAVVLSNFPSLEASELLLPPAAENSPKPSAIVKTEPRWGAASPRSDQLRGMIDSVAGTVNVAPRLIHAVIAAESNYDPKAVSPRGAIGLMQLLPATARRFGIDDPFVPRDNVFAGASYLKWLMGYFGGDIELVLAAYNAGEQAVVRAGRKVPQYPETQAYVRRIMADLHSTGSLPL